MQEQQFGLRRAPDLDFLDDAVPVQPSGERRIGEDHVETPRRQAEFRLRRAVERTGERVAPQDAHPVQAAQCQVHGGEAHHLRVHIGAVESRLLQLPDRVAAQRVAEAAPHGLAVGLDLLDAGRRGVGQADMVPGADQKPRRARGRVADRLADLRIDQPHQGADDMARGAELAEFARLPDLAQHVLEQVALGVGVHLVEPQGIQLADDLGEHGRLVDHQPGAVHEVGRAVRRERGMEREDFFAHPIDQPLAVQRIRPGRPAQEFARHAADAGRAGVARVAQRPFAFVGAGVRGGARPLRRSHPGCVRCFMHVEIDQETQLLGVLGRVRIAAAEQIIADAVDAAPEFRSHGHGAGNPRDRNFDTPHAAGFQA